MPDFDVCVIGAGPAGFAAAMRAWDFGKRICIIDRGPIGGTGVHNDACEAPPVFHLRAHSKAGRWDEREATVLEPIWKTKAQRPWRISGPSLAHRTPAHLLISCMNSNITNQ